MNKVEIKTSTGFFAVTVTGTVKPEKVQAVLQAGIASDALYRGAFQPARETVTGAKRKLEDCKPYDAQSGETLKAMVEKAIADLLDEPTVFVGEYVPPEGKADSKFTEEKAIMTRHESADDLESWLTDKVKFAGESHGDDGEFSAEALRAVREYKLDYLKNTL